MTPYRNLVTRLKDRCRQLSSAREAAYLDTRSILKMLLLCIVQVSTVNSSVRCPIVSGPSALPYLASTYRQNEMVPGPSRLTGLTKRASSAEEEASTGRLEENLRASVHRSNFFRGLDALYLSRAQCPTGAGHVETLGPMPTRIPGILAKVLYLISVSKVLQRSIA